MIKIQNLTHQYKNRKEDALFNINLHIKKGESAVLLGQSGSGKSTLINCIARLVEPKSGSILVENEDILKASPSKLRQIRKKIGVIFQEFNLIERETVIKNVLNGRLGYTGTLKSCLNRFNEEDYKIAEQSLREVGLSALQGERVSNLSGGQKQRVAIARALTQNPKVILADEPVSNLDPKLIKGILSLLGDICRKKEITLIISIHFVELIKGHFQRMIGIADGRIIFDDSFTDNKFGTHNKFSNYYNDQLIKKRLKQLGYID